jgi:hypothetical protein
MSRRFQLGFHRFNLHRLTSSGISSRASARAPVAVADIIERGVPAQRCGEQAAQHVMTRGKWGRK